MTREGLRSPNAEGIENEEDIISGDEESIAGDAEAANAEGASPDQAPETALPPKLDEVAETAIPPRLDEIDEIPRTEEEEEEPAVTPETVEETEEVPPEIGAEINPLDVGRDRIKRFGNFLGGLKNRFVEKIKTSTGKIGAAVEKAFEYSGKAGLAILSVDEIVKRGVEKGVEYTEAKYNAAKENVVAARDYVVKGVEDGIDYVKTKVEDTADFGRLAAARATERVTRPLAEFQAKMFSARFDHLQERLDKGKKINRAELLGFRKKIDLLLEVAAV